MTDRERELEEMIKSGEIGVMTECAYGISVGDHEVTNNNIKKTNRK